MPRKIKNVSLFNAVKSTLLAPRLGKTKAMLLFFSRSTSPVKHGLELEAVRTDARGRIAVTPHSKAFGSPLSHPSITLDFSEAQLEFVTPPLAREASINNFLEKLQAWSYRQIGNELLWPFSMPPKLPEHKKIPLADFGASAEGNKRNLYREGLKQRYGGAVQTISGIHYNFSLTDSFWTAYAKERGADKQLSVFKDEAYFGLMRNVIRFIPLVTYLFGASPAADKSFFSTVPAGLKKADHSTYFGPYATSLRLSDFGYQNKKRVPVGVSYNSLEEYADDLFRAVTTTSKLWSSIGVYRQKHRIQLNANILQLENEFYTSIRPKQKHHAHSDRGVVCSLACAGVEYVELRSTDIDPYEPRGVGVDQLYFLHAFMMYCLLAPSPRFKEGEHKQYKNNNSLVALRGRKPGLAVMHGGKHENFTLWSLKTLEGVAKVAESLDSAYGTKNYSRVVRAQKDKIQNPSLTPSARILEDIKKSGMSYAQFGVSLAKGYRSKQLSFSLKHAYSAEMRECARASLAETSRLEARDRWILSGFEHLELSTQVLIRAAQKRNISVEVLDDGRNVIELRHGDKKEVVKQATITRYDSYLAYELMGHKELTKIFLARAGISTPRGGHFETASEAIDFCRENRDIALVVKPASTNFGTGISIVKPRRDAMYATAVARAFKHGRILVEKFISGKEYRFLVIAGKVIAVLHREPANVVGDGKRAIKDLVLLKNADPKSYKLPDKYIKLGIVEREILAESKLTPNSIPARGQKVYLRKNSNVNDGGDPLDIPDMSEAYKKIAVKAAESVGANICGVDMIIKNRNRPPAKDSYSIIELNYNPAIFMHAYPIRGKARDVGGAILDFLGF